MLYEHEKPWTEAELKTLSTEDDRYEFKSGRLFSGVGSTQDKVSNDIAQEICAFANSFGGTLFLGVEDQTLKIDGVGLSYPKPNTQLADWLERKVAHMLEFRVPHFRISQVELTAATKKRLGKDNGVIAIDVFESELAQHQCKFDSKYYYRQNSSSNPAPHHYVAFLFGRGSASQSELVRTWCREFLNEAISSIDFSGQQLFKRFFSGNVLYKTPQWLINLNLAGEQFLRNFPDINKKLKDVDHSCSEMQLDMLDLEQKVIDSAALDELMITLLIKNSSSPSPIESLRSEDPDRVGTWLCQTWGFNSLSSDGRMHIARFTARALVGGRHPGISDEAKKVYGACALEVVPEITQVEPDFEGIAEIVKERIDLAGRELSALASELREFRHELCMRHNTSYE
ncbi:MAG: ATP-binding protein [Pyrinomonadaceae bacterium]